MSAIAAIYTSEGFVFVADGRRSESDVPPESPQFVKSDKCQKIFSIVDKTRILGYTITGLAGSDDGEFDIYREAQKQAMRLSKRGFRNLADYAKDFCQHLRKAYNLAKKQGTDFPQIKTFPDLNAWQIATVIIAGYFRELHRGFMLGSFITKTSHRLLGLILRRQIRVIGCLLAQK